MNLKFLSGTALLQGVPEEELNGLLKCFGAVRKSFPKGGVVYRAGEAVQSLGLVLAGRASIENDDVWGNRSVLDSVGPGQVFAEAYSCVPGEPLMVSVVAAEPCEIMFLNTERFLRGGQVCEGYHTVVRNLLAVTAEKNLRLSRRIFHTSSKTIRGRVLSYLSDQAAHHGSREFTIPFNRQQLADYLSVDRSALSNELSKMQRDGLLTVNRNRFCLSVMSR